MVSHHIKPSREELNRRRLKDREYDLGEIRHEDVRRGRLENWAGGRVKPLIREDEE